MFDSQRKTANLFDKDTATIYEATINSTGSWTTGNGATVRIPVMPSTTYTLHTNSLQSVFRATEITSDTLPPVDGNLIIRSSNINSCTFTTSENAKYIVFQAGVDTTQQWIQELMLNEGSTPLPYEPYGWVHSLRKLGTSTDALTTLPADVYADGNTATVGLKGQMVQSSTPSPTTPIQPQECGELETVGDKAGQYKIPISSANTTTPVYLGEVESTRQIKQLVLTGNENWYVEGSDIFYTNPITEAARHEPICSHFRGIYIFTGNNQITISQSLRINIKTNSITHTVSDFKTYLAQQYANGTPVTVWYILATPTTGIVNEPLRKIGNYADTVSGITIPTITGKDTFDVQTTLKPSEVSLAYTGWHDAEVKEWDGSEWQ